LLGEEEAAGVGAVGGMTPWGRAHPERIGRHPAEDDGVNLGEIERVPLRARGGPSTAEIPCFARSCPNIAAF